MNNSFIFVLLIIAIVMTSQVAKAYIKQRGKKTGGRSGAGGNPGEIDILEDRIQVLERIITESKYDLKKEIDNL
jgi:hypothetical protein